MPDTETTTETTTEQGDDLEQLDLAGLREAIRKERQATKDFKKLQREANELRTFKQQQEQANQTAEERAAARAKELEAKEQQLTQRERRISVRDALSAAASDQKLDLVASSATVLRLLDLDKVEFGDDGTPRNLGPLLKQLAKDEPALFAERKRPGEGGGGSGGTAVTGQDMNTILRRAIRGT